MKSFQKSFIIFLLLLGKTVFSQEKGIAYIISRNVGIGINEEVRYANIIIVPDSVKTNLVFTTIFLDSKFEEQKMYEVVGNLIKLFDQGFLPIESETAGKDLYNYYKSSQSGNQVTKGKQLYDLLTDANGVILLIAKPEDVLNKGFFLQSLRKLSGCYFPGGKEDVFVLYGDITVSTCKEDAKQHCTDFKVDGKTEKGEPVEISTKK